MCREKISKAKTQPKLSLDAGVKENKKLFYKYINRKRKTKENLHPVMDEAVNMTTEDKEKAEVLNDFFVSFFKVQTSCPRGTLPPDLDVLDEEQNKPPTIQEVRDLLLCLDCHKSMEPDEIHPIRSGDLPT